MSNRRRVAAAPEGLADDFRAGARVMTPEGFPGVVDEVLSAPNGLTSVMVTLDNGMGGGEYSESELSPLTQTAATTTTSDIKTATDDYPELGTILSDRLPIRHSVPAEEYRGGRVLASKTADLYFDTPASDMLYEAASYVMSTAAQHMGHIVTAIDDWDDLRTRYACASCGHQANQDPISVVGRLVDVCASCQAVTPYEPYQAEGWPVAARASVVALWLPPTGEGTEPPEGKSPGYTDGFRDATTINAREPKQADAEYRSDYDMGWAEGVKVVNLHPGEIPLTDADDLAPNHVLAGLGDFIMGRPPKGQEEGRNYSYDWCRFRRSSHCYYPKTLNDAASAEAGYAVWNPEDRGMCPRIKWEDQKACPAPSEPGPHVPGGFPDATVSWGDGGQRDGNHSEKVLSSVQAALADRDPLVMQPEFRFHVTSAWSDVRSKAKKIRAEGGVRIVEAKSGTVVGHVKGDTNVYETRLVRMPGSRTSVANWECGCAWAAYAWGRSPAYKRFEGRMCSHALATQYEAQARGMFGREIKEDPKQPAWMDPTMPVRQWGDYDRDKGRHASLSSGLRPTEHFEEAPAMLVAAHLQASGATPAEASAALVALGVRQAPLVAEAARDGSFMARVRGVLTELHIRAGHILDKFGDPVSGEITHPNFDPRRGLSLSTHATKTAAEEAHNGDDAEVTYWAHEDKAGLALIKRVHAKDHSSYFYLDPRTGQWVDDPYWSYISIKGSTSTRMIGRTELQALAATLGHRVLASLSAEDIAFAKSLEEAASRAEAQLTPRLKDLARQFGGDMRGLKFRLKGHVFEAGTFTPQGRTVASKIERIMQAKGVDAEKAARGINDALRYTMTFPEDRYSEAIQVVLKTLRGMGYDVMVGKAKNFWTKGDPYDGINCTMTLPSGLQWELQFHTSKSFSAKMRNHDDYEAYTNEPDPAKRKVLYDRMAGRMATVPKPRGVMDATKWMRREFEMPPLAAFMHVQAEEFWDGEDPEPALPVTYSEDDLDQDRTDDGDHDLPQMWAAAARIELALIAGLEKVAGTLAPFPPFWTLAGPIKGEECPACSGSGEQGTGHECYACDGSGQGSAYDPSVDNANPESGLLVGRDDAKGQEPVTAGRFDGIPLSIPSFPESAIRAQFEQYPQSGPDGISYFKGEINDEWHVDCLLYREGGRLVGVLNHYPQDMGPERKGNVLLLVLPEYQRKGVGSALWAEAKKRWNVTSRQDTTPEGASFLDKHGSSGDDALKEYHDRIKHQTMPDGERYPYDKPAYDRSLWGSDGPVMDEDDWKRLKHSAAESQDDVLLEPVKDGDEWVLYHQNGREVARSKDKKLLEDYRLQRDSAAKIMVALTQQEFAENVMADYHRRMAGEFTEQIRTDADAMRAGLQDDVTEAREDLGLSPLQAEKDFSGVGKGTDDDGAYVHTHRARSDSYPTHEDIPQKEIDFIESTGSLLEEHQARLAAQAEGVEVGGKDPFAHLLGGKPDSEMAAAARAFLAQSQTKTALKDFTPKERAEIIDEGIDVQASNLDLLDIKGTHYEALEDALAARAADEDDHSLEGLMWL